MLKIQTFPTDLVGVYDWQMSILKLKWLNLNTYYFGYLLFFCYFLVWTLGEGYSWEFLVGGVPPGFLNPDPISDQQNNVIFHSCF